MRKVFVLHFWEMFVHEILHVCSRITAFYRSCKFTCLHFIFNISILKVVNFFGSWTVNYDVTYSSLLKNLLWTHTVATCQHSNICLQFSLWLLNLGSVFVIDVNCWKAICSSTIYTTWCGQPKVADLVFNQMWFVSLLLYRNMSLIFNIW